MAKTYKIRIHLERLLFQLYIRMIMKNILKSTIFVFFRLLHLEVYVDFGILMHRK